MGARRLQKPGDPGIIDQHVQPASLPQAILGLRPVGLAGDVEAERACALAQL